MSYFQDGGHDVLLHIQQRPQVFDTVHCLCFKSY